MVAARVGIVMGARGRHEVDVLLVGVGVGVGAGVGLGLELEALSLTLTPTLTLEILLSCFLPALQVLDLLAEPHDLGVHRWIKHEGAHLVRGWRWGLGLEQGQG